MVFVPNKLFNTLFILFMVGVIVAIITISIVSEKDEDEEMDNTPDGMPAEELGRLEFLNGNIVFKLESSYDKKSLFYTIMRDNMVIQKVLLTTEYGEFPITDKFQNSLTLRGNNQEVTFELIVDSNQFVMLDVRRKHRKGEVARDCFDLDHKNEVHWYGGPEQKFQFWPIESLILSDYQYVPGEIDSLAITERYWLNSHGLFVYIEKEAPLFLQQNTYKLYHLCFTAKKELPYYTYDAEFTFNYKIGIAADPKAAHMEAVRRFLNKPTGIPDERMVRYPIWSTWVRYGREINETTIMDYAEEVMAHNFQNSQLDIDDLWEVCYGAMTISTQKFPNMKSLTNQLKAMGFRVTMWVHPFINVGCEPWYSEAMSKGYLIKSHSGNYFSKWWNSRANQTSHIDFNNPEALEWYRQRLILIQQNDGIDNFKFDAGETTWFPKDAIFRGNTNLHPSILTVDFVRMAASFGPLVEVRTGWGTQDLPVFVRMLDKDTRWDWNNGLPTLVTTLLQMNMNGYPFVLPDMIGGNVYNGDILTKELYIRWLQATVFMPSLQFSKSPWEFDRETIELSQTFTKLHETYADEIIKLFRLAVSDGTPVNPPLWWVAPRDEIALGIGDQFLLGEDIISAPVLIKGEISRDIYLPEGTWIDGNTPNSVYTGPQWLIAYHAPLNVLPYFIRQK